MDAKEQIREKVDVADLVSEYLQTKPAGQGAFKAICPFHAEKTPSFYISRPKQIWHCFGCDKGGDIFSFIMEMEGMEFPEALQLLAQKAGVELPKYTRGNDDNKSRLKDINGFAEKVYQKYLTTIGGKIASDYIAMRKIPNNLVEKFGLGYSPNGWTTLIDIARKKKIGGKELITAGLASQGRKGVIDKFRNRLMIPLRDHHGKTVGFTARVLSADDKPKYMNSPQTPIYDKGSLLYGLDLAKTAIKKAREVIIVEGNLDVIASHEAGVENVVASSGTALTETQIKLLKRYTNTLVFSFDTDKAGFEAGRRGMRLASSLQCNVRVAIIPPELGKDPDDLVKKDPELWQNVANSHVDKMDFLFEKLVKPTNPQDVNQKVIAGREFLPEIKSLADVIAQEHWLKRFADCVDIGVDIARAQMNSATPVSARVANTTKPTEIAKPVNSANTTDKLLDFIFSNAIYSINTAKILFESIGEKELPEGWYKMLYIEMTQVYNAINTQNPQKSFFEALRQQMLINENSTKRLDRLSLITEFNAVSTDSPKVRDATTELNLLIGQFKDRSKKDKRQLKLAEIRRAEQSGDTELIKELTLQYQTLL